VKTVELWRRLRRVRDAVVGRLLAPVARTEVAGVRLALDHPALDPAVRYLIWRGWERDDVPLLARLVRPGDVVLECGAGIGFLALQAMRRLGAARYVGVEADPTLLDLVRANFALNGLPPPELHHAALAAGDGPVRFWRSRRLWSSSLLRARADAEPVTVPGIRLATLLDRLAGEGVVPDVLVLDVEGAEVTVPPADLARVPRVLVELHPAVVGAARARAWLEAVREAGFVEVARVRETRALVRRPLET